MPRDSLKAMDLANPHRSAAAVLAVTLLCAACGAPTANPPTSAPAAAPAPANTGSNSANRTKKTTYACGAKQSFVVTYTSGGLDAIVTVDGRGTVLPRTASAAGEDFSDGKTTLHIMGDKAFIKVGDQKTFPDCKAVR